jgi:hypothetical protein
MTEITNAEEKNVYGIPYKQIENIDEIIPGKYHYNYKTVDFMFNWKESSNRLVILWHGSIQEKDKLPMFLKHNYDDDEISLLTISDKLLEYNTKNRNSMCVRSAGFCEAFNIKLHHIYIEIIKKCINLCQENKIIFLGPCIGASPAIYFGSLFNQNIILTNGWIYLSNELIKAFERASGVDNIIYYNIEEMIEKSKPKHIKIYINKQDNLTLNMNLKFINFCKKTIPNDFEVITFDRIEKIDGHNTFFPEGENFDSIIKKA